MRRKHQPRQHADRCHENDPLVRDHDFRIFARGISKIRHRDQPYRRRVQHRKEPQIPRDKKSDGIAKCMPRPFVKSALDGHQPIQVRHDQSLRNEKQRDAQQPQGNVRRSRLHRGAKEVGNHYEQNGGQYQIN